MTKGYWPPLNHIAKISCYLKVSIEYLIYGKEKNIEILIGNIQNQIKSIEKDINEIKEEIRKSNR